MPLTWRLSLSLFRLLDIPIYARSEFRFYYAVAYDFSAFFFILIVGSFTGFCLRTGSSIFTILNMSEEVRSTSLLLLCLVVFGCYWSIL